MTGNARDMNVLKTCLLSVLLSISCSLSYFEPCRAGLGTATATEAGETFALQRLELVRLADSLAAEHKYDSALALATEFLADTTGENDSLSAAVWRRRGHYESSLGDYRAAERSLQQAIEIYDSLFGSRHPGLAESRRLLGDVFRSIGRLDESERQLDLALEIFRALYGSEHPQVARTLCSRGIVLFTKGEYAEAEYVLNQSLTMAEQLLGTDDSALVRILNNLAIAYWYQGQYREAEPLYLRALSIQKAQYGEDHPYLSAVLNNLALIYNQLNQPDKVEPYLEWGIRIAENIQGPDHPKVAAYLYNLAAVYQHQGKYGKAIQTYERALRIKRQKLGHFHPDVSYGLRWLGDVYIDSGEFRQAESLLVEALLIDTTSLGPAHLYAAEDHQFLTRLYRLTGRREMALQSALREIHIRKTNFNDNFRVLPEKSALTFSQFLREAAGRYLTVYLTDRSGPNLSLDEAATVVLQTKGQVSDGIFFRQRTMVEEANPRVQAVAEDYYNARQTLAQLYVTSNFDTGSVDYRSRLDSAAMFVESLETELIRRSASYRAEYRARDVDIDDIADALDKSMVLIEYLKYPNRDFVTDTNTDHYLAIVVSRSGVEAVVDLGPAEPIDSSVSHFQKHVRSISLTWPEISKIAQTEAAAVNAELFDALWKPIERFVADRTLILIAPDGALNLIAFGGLKDRSGRYLIENYAIHYLSAGRDLMRLQSQSEINSGLLLLGDPDYDADLSSRMAATDSTEYAGHPNQTRDGSHTREIRADCSWLREGNIPPLPYSGREVRSIAREWETLTGQKAELLTGPLAGEEQFRDKAADKEVIHIATHGFFNLFCESDQSRGKLSRAADINPLLLSGLFLAGANQRQYEAGDAEVPDGVLTAYEVTRMDLSGTRWVVLSACETGLGEVAAGEGVYGLTRAFQMAGAHTVISSLWPVSDKQTAAMMKQLYVSREGSLAATLRQIAVNEINDLRRRELPDHPVSWAPFIAVGDWRAAR